MSDQTATTKTPKQLLNDYMQAKHPNASIGWCDAPNRVLAVIDFKNPDVSSRRAWNSSKRDRSDAKKLREHGWQVEMRNGIAFVLRPAPANDGTGYGDE